MTVAKSGVSDWISSGDKGRLGLECFWGVATATEAGEWHRMSLGLMNLARPMLISNGVVVGNGGGCVVI